MSKQISLWESERLSMEHSIELTIESLQAYGSLYRHWAIAFSGGKDSTATATLVAHLIATGQIPRPKSLKLPALPPLFFQQFAHKCRQPPRLLFAPINQIRGQQQGGFDRLRPRNAPRPFLGRLCSFHTDSIQHLSVFGKLQRTYLFGIIYVCKSKVRNTKRMFEHVIEGCQCEGKACSECGQKRCYGAFGKSMKAPDGLRWECKLCRKAVYEANREQVLEDRRLYYTEHAERVKARVQQYREANPELIRQQQQVYRATHLEQVTANVQRWRDAHPEQLREYDRVRRATQSEQLREYDRQYRKDHPEKERAKKHARRAREAAGGHFTDKEWLALCAFYGQRCLCCGAANVQLTPDHVIPLLHHGANTIGNIQPLCLTCNLRKGTKIIDYRQEEHVRILELIDANTWPDRWTGDEARADELLPQVLAGGIIQPLLEEVAR
jgi:5-methylcytosine-specific restriction endonuclease McrA